MKQIALPISAGNEPSFDNYLAEGSASALQVVQASLKGPGAPLVYLWGPPGTGKTHLLRAAWRQQAAMGLGAGQMGLWPELDLAQSGVDHQQAFDPAWRVILLDDVHRFTPAQQQTAFAWMIHAQSAGCNVVAAGPVPPVNLTLRDDVRSRLSQGQVMALHPLSEAHVREVLTSAAHARGIVLSHEVLDYVMLRFSRDLTSLHQLLDRLDTFSLEAKRSVTVPLINAMFKSMEGDS